MEAVSQHACRVANRVALGMRYGETSGHRAEARQIVQEVLGATCELLDLIDPVQLRDWFEQFHAVYEQVANELANDPVRWSRFLGTQCDMLHAVGLHQKTIASVGNELAVWTRTPITFEELADTLDGLAGLVTEHANVLGEAIEGQAGREAKSLRRTELFSNAVGGLTVVLVSIDQAIKAGDPRDADCAAMATFGAALAVKSVAPLRNACGLAQGS